MNKTIENRCKAAIMNHNGVTLTTYIGQLSSVIIELPQKTQVQLSIKPRGSMGKTFMSYVNNLEEEWTQLDKHLEKTVKKLRQDMRRSWKKLWGDLRKNLTDFGRSLGKAWTNLDRSGNQ